MKTSAFVLASTIVALASLASAGTPDQSACDVWQLACHYTASSREATYNINYVVVHKTEGATAAAAASWFANCASGGSAHYNYDKSNGRCYQSVREKDVAWHAGYSSTNNGSIGIEHSGWVANNDTSTACYDRSAIEVRSCITYYGVPCNRTYIIGHNQVPGCGTPGGGGKSCHTDPGRYWNWAYYMSKCGSSAPPPPVQNTFWFRSCSTGVWKLRNSNSAGGIDIQFQYGGGGRYAVCGDWNGDGTDTIGTYSGGTWDLRNSNSAGGVDYHFSYGTSDGYPVKGNWDGVGSDGIGVYYKSTARWDLRQTPSAGASEISFQYGSAYDFPVTGNWDAQGGDGIGVVRPGYTWALRQTPSGGSAEIQFQFGAGTAVPVAGNWDGSADDGYGIGLFYNDGYWDLRQSPTAGGAEVRFQWGAGVWAPVVGDWDGNRTCTIGTCE